MNIKLPMCILRRIVRKNPWLLSTSGVVSRSLIVEVLLWEITVDTSWELLPEERERLIAERDRGLLKIEDRAQPPP